MKIAIRVYWFLDTFVYSGMIGGCLAGWLVGWLVDWRGSAAVVCGVLLDFAWKVRVDAMEYVMIDAKVPKGFVRDGWQLVIGEKTEGDCLVCDLMRTMYGEHQWLILRPIGKNPSRPSDWKPPKMMEGWLTWDGKGGWRWWPNEPGYSEEYGWVAPKAGQEIAVVMAKFLGCPCCDGFDERECIWEVGR